MKLSVIIPVYNEEKTILEIIRRVDAVVLPGSLTKEILVIDDGSTDGTLEKLKSLGSQPHIKIFPQAQNKGKTEAVKIGFKHATGDIFLMQDADLEYDPKYYPDLLKPILEGKAKVVFGSRFMGRISDMAPINRISNNISNLTIRLYYGSKMTDLHTCYKVFTRDVLNGIEIKTERFSFDTELTVKILKKGIAIHEVPINYTARKRSEGKKITWSTALDSYFYLLRSKFSNT